MSLKTRFVLLDKYFKNSKESDSATMLWRLYDGQYSIVRQVNLNERMYFSVYLLVQPKYCEEMARNLHHLTTDLMSRKNKTFLYKIYLYQETVPFKSTCNMWGSIGIDVLDQCVYNAKIFRICCNRQESADELYNIFLTNSRLGCGKYHCYQPTNLEIELLLANVFPTVDCQGPYITGYDQGHNRSELVSTIYRNIHIMSLHRFHLVHKYVQYMVPLACVNITFNAKNEIVGSTMVANVSAASKTSSINATPETLLQLLQRVPRCAISVVLASDLGNMVISHSPNDEIAFISIFLTRSSNKNDYIICHLINRNVMTSNLDLTADNCLVGGKCPRRLFCVYDNEQTLLTKFIQYYCQNNMFVDLSGKSKANNSVHFVYGRHSINSINAVIMDRIFHHNMWSLIYNCIGFSDHSLLLNCHAIVLDLVTEQQRPLVCKTHGLTFKPHELPVCWLDKLRAPLTVAERNSLQIPLEKCPLHAMDYVRKWHTHQHRTFVSDTEIYARVEINSRNAMQNIDVINLLNTSIELCNFLKFNLREINTVSTLTLCSHYLFLHFLRHGIFLCSSVFRGGVPPAIIKYSHKPDHLLKLSTFDQRLSQETFNMFRQSANMFAYAKSTELVPILQKACTTMNLFNGLTGGWWYSKLGRFSVPCQSFDFSSFYPSIVASFGLDFSNHCIMSGPELYAFASKQPISADPKHLDSLYFILDLYAPPPNCQLLRMSQVTQKVNYASVYLCLCTVYSNTPDTKRGILCEMMSEAIAKFMTENLASSTLAERKVYKHILNATIGCFGNEAFYYHSASLLMAIHALGQYVMSMTIKYLCSSLRNVADPFTSETTLVDDRVLKVCTDSILWAGDPCNDRIETKIEQFLAQLLSHFHLSSCLRVRIEFETDFVFSYKKSTLFYRSQSGEFCGAEISNYRHVIDKIYKNIPLLEKEHYSNLRLALIYMYGWVRDTYPRKNDSIIQYYKRIVELDKSTLNFKLQLTYKDNSSSIVAFFLATSSEQDWMIDPAGTTPDNCEIQNELIYLRKILLKSIQ